MISKVGDNFGQVRSVFDKVLNAQEDKAVQDERTRLRVHQELTRLNRQISEYEEIGLETNELKNRRFLLEEKQQKLLDDFILNL